MAGKWFLLLGLRGLSAMLRVAVIARGGGAQYE
jgi:hypothetical protein